MDQGTQQARTAVLTPLMPLEGLEARSNYTAINPSLSQSNQDNSPPARHDMVATTICHEDFENLPHPLDNGKDFEPFTHVYSVRKFTQDKGLVWGLFRKGLVDQHNWAISSLPFVHLVTTTLKPRSSHIVVYCASTRTHIKLKGVSRMVVKQRDTGASHTISLTGSGRSVGKEVFVAEFQPVQGFSGASPPIDHLTACRVATRFAQSCKAGPSSQYSTAVLGLWRSQMQEHIGGNEIKSDLNLWTIALTIPPHVDRSKFLAYFTESLSIKQFQFKFLGSEKYCTFCANNSVHQEGEQCSSKDQGQIWRGKVEDC